MSSVMNCNGNKRLITYYFNRQDYPRTGLAMSKVNKVNKSNIAYEKWHTEKQLQDEILKNLFLWNDYGI